VQICYARREIAGWGADADEAEAGDSQLAEPGAMQQPLSPSLLVERSLRKGDSSLHTSS